MSQTGKDLEEVANICCQLGKNNSILTQTCYSNDDTLIFECNDSSVLYFLRAYLSKTKKSKNVDNKK